MHNIFSINEYDQNRDMQKRSNKNIVDKKPKFIPKRMTTAEEQRLSAYVQKKIKAFKNEKSLKKYQQIEALLEELASGKLIFDNPKDEKKYTEYFGLVVSELEFLGKDPREILQIPDLRYRLLAGELDTMPWFVKEIEALVWFFEQDAKKLMFQVSQLDSAMPQFNMTKPQWPRPADKALYVIDLVEQIERSHQRVDVDVLAGIIETAEEYLVSFLPNVSNVLKRTIEEALNKLEKVRNIRDIPPLKE